MNHLIPALALRPLHAGLDVLSSVFPDRLTRAARDALERRADPPLPATLDAYQESGSDRVSSSLRWLPQNELLTLLHLTASSVAGHNERLRRAGLEGEHLDADHPLRREVALRDRDSAVWIRLELERLQRAAGLEPGAETPETVVANRLLQFRHDQLGLLDCLAQRAERLGSLAAPGAGGTVDGALAQSAPFAAAEVLHTDSRRALQRLSYSLQMQALMRAQMDAGDTLARHPLQGEPADWTTVSQHVQCLRLIGEAQALQEPYRKAIEHCRFVTFNPVRRTHAALGARLALQDAMRLHLAASRFLALMRHAAVWQQRMSAAERLIPPGHAILESEEWTMLSTSVRELTEIGALYRQAAERHAAGEMDLTEANRLIDAADARLLTACQGMDACAQRVVELQQSGHIGAFIARAQEGIEDEEALPAIADAVRGVPFAASRMTGALQQIQPRIDIDGVNATIHNKLYGDPADDPFVAFVGHTKHYAAVTRATSEPFLYEDLLSEHAPYKYFVLYPGPLDLPARPDLQVA